VSREYLQWKSFALAARELDGGKKVRAPRKLPHIHAAPEALAVPDQGTGDRSYWQSKLTEKFMLYIRSYRALYHLKLHEF
jgi:hypothetical protein